MKQSYRVPIMIKLGHLLSDPNKFYLRETPALKEWAPTMLLFVSTKICRIVGVMFPLKLCHLLYVSVTMPHVQKERRLQYNVLPPTVIWVWWPRNMKFADNNAPHTSTGSSWFTDTIGTQISILSCCGCKSSWQFLWWLLNHQLLSKSCSY